MSTDILLCYFETGCSVALRVKFFLESCGAAEEITNRLSLTMPMGEMWLCF
jgi:hypothetical protein